MGKNKKRVRRLERLVELKGEQVVYLDELERVSENMTQRLDIQLGRINELERRVDGLDNADARKGDGLAGIEAIENRSNLEKRVGGVVRTLYEVRASREFSAKGIGEVVRIITLG